MNKSICIISHQHLAINPRVLKESITLAEAGFKVTVLASVYSERLLEEDYKLIKNKNISYLHYNNLTKKNYTSYKNRTINKLGRLANKYFVENKWALGYAPLQCLFAALKQHADLYICHQELPTYVGILLLQKGKKVAFDIEDWYSEDLLPHARKYRPQRLLEKAEKTALSLGNLVYTTSVPMAKALAKRYQSKEPEVIFNSFESYSTPSKINTNQKIKLIWISQTIGPGRGLEGIIQSLNEIFHLNFELNLIGNASENYKESLNNLLVNKSHHIFFLPLIPNLEIQKALINYDIGLALELNTPVSRDLTITNKILHYLSVGLPVIASATQGQLSLKKDFEGIFYYRQQEELTQILSHLNPIELSTKREAILATYKEKYDWEICKKKILNLTKDILNNE